LVHDWEFEATKNKGLAVKLQSFARLDRPGSLSYVNCNSR